MDNCLLFVNMFLCCFLSWLLPSQRRCHCVAEKQNQGVEGGKLSAQKAYALFLICCNLCVVSSVLKVNGIPYSEKEKIETGHTRQRAKTMKTGTTQLSGEHKHKRSHEGIPGSLLKYNTPETIKIIVKMQAIVRGNRVRKAVQMMST